MRREARTPIHGNETVASPLSVRPLCVRQVIYEVAEGTVIFYLFQIISSAIYLFNQRVGMDGYFIQVHPDHKLTCAHTHSHIYTRTRTRVRFGRAHRGWLWPPLPFRFGLGFLTWSVPFIGNSFDLSNVQI